VYLLTWLLSLAYFSENIKTAMIEYKKFVSPQAGQVSFKAIFKL